MEIDAFIEGRIDLAPPAVGTELRRESVNSAFPLPNIGAWYMYSWSPKWVFSARLDWLSITLGDYSGGLSDALIGVNYQISDTFGVGLSYNRFNLDVDVKKTDWHGQVETGQAGPRLTLTAAW